RTEEQHFAIGAVRVNEVEPRILENNSPENASGVNNVDIDEEIVDQVKNQIRYMFVSRLAAANFSALRASIKGRFDR
ncbi:MAG: flagellar basal body rod protein FlgB, partial [Calditrichaeota bacterium]